MPTDRTDKKWTIVVGGIVALVTIVAATVLGLTITNPDSDSTPVLVTLLGLIAPTIVSLLALLKGLDNAQAIQDNTETTLDLHEKVTNGFMDMKIQKSMAVALEDAVENGTVRSGENNPDS